MSDTENSPTTAATEALENSEPPMAPTLVEAEDKANEGEIGDTDDSEDDSALLALIESIECPHGRMCSSKKSCQKIHPIEEPPVPSVGRKGAAPRRQGVCFKFNLSGGCHRGAKCRYAHVIDESIKERPPRSSSNRQKRGAGRGDVTVGDVVKLVVDHAVTLSPPDLRRLHREFSARLSGRH